MKILVLLYFIISTMFVCGQSEIYTLVEDYIFVQNETLENKKWQVVWEDDFNGSELDTAK
jgi:hypothetical protein